MRYKIGNTVKLQNLKCGTQTIYEPTNYKIECIEFYSVPGDFIKIAETSQEAQQLYKECFPPKYSLPVGVGYRYGLRFPDNKIRFIRESEVQSLETK